MWNLEASIFRSQPIRILRWSRFQKRIQSDMGALERSLSRIHPSRISSWSKEENDFPVAGDHLKHRFLDVTKVEFLGCQDADNDF